MGHSGTGWMFARFPNHNHCLDANLAQRIFDLGPEFGPFPSSLRRTVSNSEFGILHSEWNGWHRLLRLPGLMAGRVTPCAPFGCNPRPACRGLPALPAVVQVVGRGDEAHFKSGLSVAAPQLAGGHQTRWDFLHRKPGRFLIWFVTGDDDAGNFSSLNNFTRIPGLYKCGVGTQPRPLFFVVLVLELIHFGVHILILIRQFLARHFINPAFRAFVT